MKENTRFTSSRVTYTTSLVLAVTLLLLWNSVAYAQSREDQYGSPTEPVDHVSRASDMLSVLPDTGGPMILLAGVALVMLGAGMALIGRWGVRG